MPAWLIVLLLEALGLFLLWNGARGGGEVQSSLGAILVVSVTALFLFRLLADFLRRRHSGKVPATRARPEPFMRLRQFALLGTLLPPGPVVPPVAGAEARTPRPATTSISISAARGSGYRAWRHDPERTLTFYR